MTDDLTIADPAGIIAALGSDPSPEELIAAGHALVQGGAQDPDARWSWAWSDWWRLAGPELDGLYSVEEWEANGGARARVWNRLGKTNPASRAGYRATGCACWTAWRSGSRRRSATTPSASSTTQRPPRRSGR